MSRIKVFRNRDDVKKAFRSDGIELFSRLRSCRISVIDSNEIEIASSEGELYFLVQGQEVIGMALDYDDANKGFRIMAHQQYLDGDSNQYPIEIFNKKEIIFEPGGNVKMSLDYVFI